jgi:MFS family permease
MPFSPQAVSTVGRAPGLGSAAHRLLFLALASDVLFVYLYVVVLQAYLPESLHVSAAVAAYALAAYGGAKTLTQVAGGFASDRLGRGVALRLGIVCTGAGASFIWLGAHTWPPAVVPAAAVDGLGSALLWPALYGLSATLVRPSARGSFGSALTLFEAAAIGIGLALGVAVDAAFSFDGAMVVALCLALSMFLLLPPSRSEVPPSLSPADGRGPVRVGSLEGSFLPFFVLQAGLGMAVGVAGAAFRAYGRDVLGLAMVEEVVVLAPAALSCGIAVIAGRGLSSRTGRSRTMARGFAVAALSLGLVGLRPGLLGASVFLAIGAAALGLVFPSITATLVDFAGRSRRGGLQTGWLMTAGIVGRTAGPALAGFVIAFAGARYIPAVIALLLAFVAVCAMTLEPRARLRFQPSSEPAR